MGNNLVRFDRLDDVWRFLTAENPGAVSINLTDVETNKTWKLTRHLDDHVNDDMCHAKLSFVPVRDNPFSCRLEGELASNVGPLPAHLRIFAQQPRISLQVVQDSLTKEGQKSYACREIIPLYTGHPRQMVRTGNLRLGLSHEQQIKQHAGHSTTAATDI